MITTKEKSAVNMQKIMIKVSQHTTSKSHQITGRKEQMIYKTVRK